MVINLENKKVNILGLQVNALTMAEFLDFVDDTIKRGEFARILTLNAEIAYLSKDDLSKKNLINSATVVTPDGSGIMWAAERYGSSIKERVSGVDLADQLLARGNKEGYKFYFLGTKADIVADAVANMREKYGANIVGFHDGYFTWEESPAIAAEIKESGANILFVAMGYPRQDLWIDEFWQAADINIGMGVGGTFDVFAGRAKRAPKIWQNLRMEWLYRLCIDPRRLKRTMNLPRFMQAVNKDIREQRK